MKTISVQPVSSVLQNHFLPIEKLPDNYSFRVLIKFRQFGFEGNHICAGYWWHKHGELTVDSSEYEKYDPIGWVPLYESIGI